MLTQMRERATSWIIKILLILIAVVFIFLGIGNQNARQQNRVAVVNDETISVEAYREAYQGLVNRIRSQFGGQVSQELLDAFKVREQALDQVINRVLMRQEAEVRGIRVTDAELQVAISSFSAFQKNGSFDPETYNALLEQNRLTPTRFEALQREELVMRKLQDAILGGIAVSDDEARAWFDNNRRTVDAKVAVFKPSSVTPSEPADAVVATFYEENKATWRTQPKVKVEYLRFAADGFTDKVEVDDTRISDWYEERIERFTEAEKVAARHILIAVAEDADEAVVAEKKAALEAIREKALAGDDFAELARAHSEGPSASSGGELGSFTRETMVKPFADAAFAMEKGAISEPVRTRFGWHLIKVEDRIPAKVRSLEEVRGEIRTAIVEEEARNRAWTLADEVYEETLSGAGVKEAAMPRNLDVITTGFFDSMGPVTGVADAAGFAQAAFSLEEGETSELLEFGDAIYLLQVEARKPAVIPALDEIRDAVVLAVKEDEKARTARASAVAFLSALKDGASMDAIEGEVKPALVETGFFGRGAQVPEIGYAPELANALFALARGEKYPEAPVAVPDGVAVFALKEVKLPENELFLLEKDNTVDELLNRKRGEAFQGWIESLRKAADLHIEEGYATR